MPKKKGYPSVKRPSALLKQLEERRLRRAAPKVEKVSLFSKIKNKLSRKNVFKTPTGKSVKINF